LFPCAVQALFSVVYILGTFRQRPPELSWKRHGPPRSFPAQSMTPPSPPVQGRSSFPLFCGCFNQRGRASTSARTETGIAAVDAMVTAARMMFRKCMCDCDDVRSDEVRAKADATSLGWDFLQTAIYTLIAWEWEQSGRRYDHRRLVEVRNLPF
jgi:hypothetical protein